MPNGLLYLASYLQQFKYTVIVKDLNCIPSDEILKLVKNDRFAIVGISMLFYPRKEAYGLIKKIHALDKRIKIVVGGMHLSFFPTLLVNNLPIDAAVIGEGELTLKELADLWIRGQGELKDIHGIVTKTYGAHKPRQPLEDIDRFPMPDYTQIRLEHYDGCGLMRARSNGVINGIKIDDAKFANIITSRGCSGRCKFCNAYKLWRYKTRFRSAGNVLKEIRFLYRQGVRIFNFDDDSFGQDRAQALRICKAIVKSRLRIAWATIMQADDVDEELLSLMKRAGCYAISFGIESGSHKVLKHIGKRPTRKMAKTAIALTKAAGMTTIALIMIGNIGETDSTMNATIGFMKRLKADHYSSVGCVWALPGTKYYDILLKNNSTEINHWLRPQDGAPIFHDRFTARDLKRWHHMMRKGMHSMGTNPEGIQWPFHLRKA